MPKTAGQKLGSILVPLYLLAILAGMVAGGIVVAVVSLVSAVQMAVEIERGLEWVPGGTGIVLAGILVGAGVAVVPATGSAVGLFVQAWISPFPPTTAQAWAAGWGACSASALLGGAVPLTGGGEPAAFLAIGAIFAVLSFLIAFAITARLLRHMAARELADGT